MPDRQASPPTVVIVGPCASGKTTLANNLRQHGVDARVSGQEHSEIRSLWQRLEPDLLVGLHVDLATVRARRGASWSEHLFQCQLARLRDAYGAAHLHLDTAALDEKAALSAVLRMVKDHLPG